MGHGARRAAIIVSLLAPQVSATDTVREQLETGLSCLADGRYAEAQIAFESVFHFEDQPPDLITQVEVYEKAARDYLGEGRRLSRFAYSEAGFGGYRVNSTPASATPCSRTCGLAAAWTAGWMADTPWTRAWTTASANMRSPASAMTGTCAGVWAPAAPWARPTGQGASGAE